MKYAVFFSNAVGFAQLCFLIYSEFAHTTYVNLRSVMVVCTNAMQTLSND